MGHAFGLSCGPFAWRGPARPEEAAGEGFLGVGLEQGLEGVREKKQGGDREPLL